MKKLILFLASLLCASNLLAAEPFKPGQFLPKFDTYSFTNHGVVMELTVKTNFLDLMAKSSAANFSARANGWKAGKDWFVYVGKDLLVWAGDGNKGYWYLKATGTGSTVGPMQQAKEAPPKEVAKRLPKEILDVLPAAQP